MLQNRQQIGEVVVGGVGNNKNIFKGVDEALLKCFSDFLGVAIMVASLGVGENHWRCDAAEQAADWRGGGGGGGE